MTRKATCKLITYIRVSSKGQGESGLGLEAQQAAVEAYCVSLGCTIVAEYREVESGKRNDRPELAKAMVHARRIGATLVIAKLDRLARNIHFVSGLMESGVDFVACDCPNDDKFMIHIRACFAEEEGRKISDRTKAALQAAKARGVKLGGYRPAAAAKLTDEVRGRATKASAAARKGTAAAIYSDLLPTIEEHRSAGLSLRQVADRLNADGHTTRTGASWGPVQVKRVLDRAR